MSLHPKDSTEACKESQSQQETPVGLSILVADDDPLTRRLMTRMLHRLKHCVQTAEDGLQALAMVRDAWKARDETRFDAIVRLLIIVHRNVLTFAHTAPRQSDAQSYWCSMRARVSLASKPAYVC